MGSEMCIRDRADYLENSHALQQKVSQAVVYPIFLFFVCTAILVLLITLVVPKVVKVYDDTGQDLPWLTVVVIKISDFLVEYGVIVGLVLAVLLLLINYIFKQDSPRYWLHSLYLKITGVRKMVQNIDSCLLYTSPSPRDLSTSRMPSSA